MAMQTSKYLLANERDALWGLTVSTVGYEEIAPGDSYPTRGHADGYYFELDRGRELNEYLAKYAGHIGYSVRPSERRRGYATRNTL